MTVLKVQQREPGFLLRRLIHLAIIIIPLLYYLYGEKIAACVFLTPEQLVSILVALTLAIELLRLKQQWRGFGQRAYENQQISSAAWTIFAIGLVLLQAPKIGIHHAAIGMPLIFALACGDPIMGEARLFKLSAYWVIGLGMLIITLVWLLCAIWLGTPWWLALIMPALTVAAEYKAPAQIDDNAAMLLLPLVVILFLAPWF